METIKLKISGDDTPLLMHSNRAANPLSVEAMTIKQLSSKKNKTDADHAIIARHEWESGMYLHNGLVVMPAPNLEKCLVLGARRRKLGKQFEEGLFIADNYMPLDYRGPKIRLNGDSAFPHPELDKVFKDGLLVHQTMVRVQRNTILRTRPIFYDWSFAVTIDYDEDRIDERDLLDCASIAGKYIGLCERRPRLGRFNVKLV